MTDAQTKETTAVARLQKWGPLMQKIFQGLQKVDVGRAEDETGTFLSPSKLQKAYELEFKVFAAYKTQRERLMKVNRPATVGGMIERLEGDELSEWLLVLYYRTRKLSECDLPTPLAADDKALPAYSAFVNEAIAALLKREYLGKGTPKIPKYTATGISQDSMSVGGHSPTLKAAQAAKKAS